MHSVPLSATKRRILRSPQSRKIVSRLRLNLLQARTAALNHMQILLEKEQAILNRIKANEDKAQKFRMDNIGVKFRGEPRTLRILGEANGVLRNQARRFSFERMDAADHYADFGLVKPTLISGKPEKLHPLIAPRVKKWHPAEEHTA